MKNRNILFFLTVTILLSPQLSMCSESQGWSYMPSFFKAGGKALQSAANYAGNSMLSLWNSMNDRAKVVFFGAIAATLVAAGYKIWWQKPDSNKIEEVAPPAAEEPQKSSTSSSGTEPEVKVIESSEQPIRKEETEEEYRKRFEEFKKKKIEQYKKVQAEAKLEKEQLKLSSPIPPAPEVVAFQSPAIAERLKKEYPIFLFNGYDTKIVYNLTDLKNFESGELDKRAKELIGYASLNGTEVTIKDKFKQDIPTIQVRSSGPGSRWGARPWTDFNADFNTDNKKKSSLSIWKGLIEYHITQSANPKATKAKEISSFDIDLFPQESKGWLQVLPTTSFEGTLTPRYLK